jgi:hypothetical protein
MECKRCHSQWNTEYATSRTWTTCPVCGENLCAEDDSKLPPFDNSRDTLVFIAGRHGADVLLGNQLKNFFPDYAPGIATLRKNVVFSVSTSGAADILKKNLAAKESEREVAYKQAVQRVIDTFGTERSLVEEVVREFADALGWKISAPVATPTPVPHIKQVAPAPQVKQAAPAQILPQLQPVQTQPSADLAFHLPTAHPPGNAIGIAAEIAGGKKRNVQFGGCDWRVLDVQGDRALLLTENIIEIREYHSSFIDITWASCELRQYLNGDFLRKFSSQDQSRIWLANNCNSDNQWFGTKGGDSTTDKVFLLSIEEVVKYFGDSGQLHKRPKKDSWWIDDKYNNERMAKYEDKAWWWWLRSPGIRNGGAASVYRVGGLYMGGNSVNRVGGGVRPALWLNLKS